MGYYVRTKNSDIAIPKEKLKEAYKRMCALNVTHHSEKRGGSWGAEGKELSRHFSWMDTSYPKTCKDACSILEKLGFSTEYDKEGNLAIHGYNNKTGQEDLFFEAIASLVVTESGSKDYAPFIEWVGEDDDGWKWEFKDGKMNTLPGKTVYG